MVRLLLPLELYTAGTLCDVAGVDCSACSTGYTLSATAAAGSESTSGSQTCIENSACSASGGSDSCAAAAKMTVSNVGDLIIVCFYCSHVFNLTFYLMF